MAVKYRKLLLISPGLIQLRKGFEEGLKTGGFVTGLKRAFQNKLHSLRASSPGRSGGGAGKGRRACTASLEFEYLHRKVDAKC